MRLEDLTPEQIEKIQKYKSIVEKTYIDKKPNRKATVEYIEYMYNLCKFEKPVVLVADNPQQFKVMYETILKDPSHINRIYKLKSKGKGVEEEKEYEDSLKMINPDEDPDLAKAIKQPKTRSHYVWLISSFAKAYLSYYHYINKVLGISCENEKELDYLYNLSIQADLGRCFFEDNYVICLKFPDRVYFNENSQLHNIEAPAIQYNGQPGYCYVNGIHVPSSIFEKIQKKELKMEEFVELKNEEVKSACISMIQELFGEEGVFNFFRTNLKEISSYVDKKEKKYLEGTTKSMNVGVYNLFKGVINRESVAYVRCYCPSTDRMFFLGVDPVHEKAEDAIASLLLIPNKIIGNIKNISRQGEVFSIVLDEEGNKIVKTLTKTDYQERSCLSGKDYFKKITYEY